MQIRLDTSQTRETAQYLIAQAEQLSQIGQALHSVVAGLETGAWDGVSRARAEPLLGRVRPESEQAAEQLETLGRQLLRVAEAFEQADQTLGAQASALPWLAAGTGPEWRTNPSLRLGTLLTGGGVATTMASLPYVGAPLASFFEGLKNIPTRIGEWLSPAIDRFARALGWTPIKDLEPAQVLEGGDSLSGDTPATMTTKTMPKVTSEVEVRPLSARQLTPVLKQPHDSFECAPTAASMVLGYYHTLDSENATRTPQELIKSFGNRFNPRTGMTATELVDGLKEMDLGYDTIDYQAGLDQETLQAELENGPVVAQVHVNWATNTYAHMVTVTGMSENGETVYVNDPWTGEAEEIAWSTFENSWTFGDPPASYSNLIVRIRP